MGKYKTTQQPLVLCYVYNLLLKSRVALGERGKRGGAEGEGLVVMTRWHSSNCLCIQYENELLVDSHCQPTLTAPGGSRLFAMAHVTCLLVFPHSAIRKFHEHAVLECQSSDSLCSFTFTSTANQMMDTQGQHACESSRQQSGETQEVMTNWHAANMLTVAGVLCSVSHELTLLMAYVQVPRLLCLLIKCSRPAHATQKAQDW